MSSVFFGSASRIISQVLSWLQASNQGKTTNLITDAFQSGIDRATLAGEGFTIVPGTSALSVTVQGQGIAYDSLGNRIFISSSDTTPYNSSNTTQTTNDGLGNFLLTPQSTGCVNIPLTGLNQNYLWVDYLATTDTSAFTLNKITNAKIFYKLTDGYNIRVTTVNTPPDAASVFLGSVDLTGISSGLVPSSVIFQIGRTYFSVLPDILPGQIAEAVTTLLAYRRPVLQYNSSTIVNVETGLDGVLGETQILFPDGITLKDSTAGDIQCNLLRNASWTSGTIQSGLDTGTISSNTWYNFYAVKVTKVGSTNRFVIVASLNTPTQNNFSTLNSNFGTNGWVYLGTVPYGDNASAPAVIPVFIMEGNGISFGNLNATGPQSMTGVTLATVPSTALLFWIYGAGSSLSSGQLPPQLTTGSLQFQASAVTGGLFNCAALTTGAVYYANNAINPVSTGVVRLFSELDLQLGAELDTGSFSHSTITLVSYRDRVLGIGANPLL